MDKIKQEQGQAKEEVANATVVYRTDSANEAKRLIDRRYEQAKAMEKAGNPVAWLYYGPPHEILHCFDVLDVYPENFGAACAIQEKTSPYLEYAEELGFSTNTCSYLRIEVGISRAMERGESTANAPYGGLANPTMFITSSRMCDPRIKVFDTTRRFLNIPVFMYDYMQPPIEDPRIASREACEQYIDHTVEGFNGMIAFLEKQTGRKLDWDRFNQVVRNSIEMWHLLYDICQLRRNTPSPLPSEDHWIMVRPYVDMTGEQQAVEFFKNTKKELQERVAKKVSVVPVERHRILWLGLPPWLDMGIYNYLESKGAVSVAETIFHAYKPVEVDLSDPLRALAEKWFWGWDGGGSDGTNLRCGAITGGNHILNLVKEFNIDGVIAHSVISCRAVSIGHKHMAKEMRERTGLPVLYLESDMTDPRAYSKTEVREKVDAFIQVLDARR